MLSFTERTGDDLSQHHRREECERCSALLAGAEPRHSVEEIEPFPDDAKDAFLAVLSKTGELDEALA